MVCGLTGFLVEDSPRCSPRNVFGWWFGWGWNGKKREAGACCCKEPPQTLACDVSLQMAGVELKGSAGRVKWHMVYGNLPCDYNATGEDVDERWRRRGR
jgi:hypothetical protein